MIVRELRGRPVARTILQTAREQILELRDKYQVTPALHIVRIGDDPSTIAYARSIARVCERVNLTLEAVELPESVSSDEVENAIRDLNRRDDVHGIIVMHPLPPHLDRRRVASLFSPLKDIDGMASTNAGRLMLGDVEAFAPSTPAGGLEILHHYEVPIAGEHAVVVGRSPIVGLPMALMLLAEDATVSIAHSHTRDLESLTRQADILVSAVGRPNLIRGEMVKPGATVIDFGISVVDDELVGDVDRKSVADVAGALTPVPGGTGTVTAAILVRNTLKAARLQLQAS